MEVTGFPEKESNLCFIFHRLTQVSQGTTISVQDEGIFFSFFTGQILQKKYLDLKDAKINILPCIIHQDFWYNLKRNYNRLSFKKKEICFVCNNARLGSNKRDDPSTKSPMVTPVHSWTLFTQWRSNMYISDTGRNICINCSMNALFSFYLFIVYIPECKQQLRTMK